MRHARHYLSIMVGLLFYGACAHYDHYRERRIHAQALLAEESPSTAIEAYLDLINSAPSTVESAQATCELAEGLYHREPEGGEWDRVVEELLRRALTRLSGAAPSRDVLAVRARVANDLSVMVAKKERHHEALELYERYIKGVEGENSATFRSTHGSILLAAGRLEEGALDVIEALRSTGRWSPGAARLLEVLNKGSLDYSYGIQLAGALVDIGGVPETSNVLMSMVDACRRCDGSQLEDMVLLAARHLRDEPSALTWWEIFSQKIFAQERSRPVQELVEQIGHLLRGERLSSTRISNTVARQALRGVALEEAERARSADDVRRARRLYAAAWEIDQDAGALGYAMATCLDEQRRALAECRPILEELLAGAREFVGSADSLAPGQFTNTYLMMGDLVWSLRDGDNDARVRAALVYWRTALVPYRFKVAEGGGGLPLAVLRRLAMGYQYFGQSAVASRYQRRTDALLNGMKRAAAEGTGWAWEGEWIQQEVGGDRWAVDPRGRSVVPVRKSGRTVYLAATGKERPGIGDVAAPVTIIQFDDFGCTSCSAAATVMDTVWNGYPTQLRVVHWQNPYRAHNATSQQASEAALCAWEQDKFSEMSGLLIKQSEQGNSSFTRASLVRLARQAGVETIAMGNCLQQRRYAGIVNEDISRARKIGVTPGAPAFYLNGKALESWDEIGSVLEKVDEALAKGVVHGGGSGRQDQREDH